MNKVDLKSAGLKATLPRLKILQLLEHAPQRHLSAEEIFRHLAEAGDDIGLATVYRVLAQFETAGLVKRHRFDDHSLFELANSVHHDHIVCIRCNHVEEFIDPIIESHQEKIAKQMGYALTDHSLLLYGICKRCAE